LRHTGDTVGVCKRMNAGKSKRKKAKYDWPTIRHEYVTSPAGKDEITLEMIAQKSGCKIGYLYQKSSAECWPKLREDHRRKVEVKTQEKAAETEAERRVRHAKIMRIIQASGITAIQNSDAKASPRDTIEAVKMERALYGESGEHVKVDLPGMTPEKAAALWRGASQFDEKNDGAAEKAE
jgi:hypothetical protein